MIIYKKTKLIPKFTGIPAIQEDDAVASSTDDNQQTKIQSANLISNSFGKP